MPDRIFQILITDGDTESVSFSDAMEHNIASFKAIYPNAAYHRYSNEELLDFLSENFSDDVLNTYSAMQPYAYKADLARYCLLYMYGGLYSDLSYMHVRAMEVGEDTDMVVFCASLPEHPSWVVSNAIIYAKPASAVLERMIDRIVVHHKTGYYGVHHLEPTGPYLFGRVLAETEDWRSILFGYDERVNVDATGRHNILKLMPGGEIIAIRNKTRNAQISDLIGSGGNSYHELWDQRRIWGEEKPTGIESVLERIKSRVKVTTN